MPPSLRFGRYTAEALLGPGGVTETYRARLGTAERTFALKLLRTDRAGEHYEEVARRFVAAATRWASVRLPGIAPVVEVYAEPDATFAVTDLVPGLDVEAASANVARLDGGERAAAVGLVGAAVARSLAAAHARRPPLLHMGLQPGDVVVTPSGDVALLDLGLFAAVRDLTESPVEKWRFVAPEVIAGAPADAAADLYSLGAVLFMLLTGRPPHAGETVGEIAAAAAEGPPPIPAPPRLAAVLRALLAPEPSDRPQHAEEAAMALASGIGVAAAEAKRELARLVHGAGPAPQAPAPPQPEPPAPAPPPRRARPVLLAGAIGAVAAAAAAGMFLVPRWADRSRKPAAPTAARAPLPTELPPHARKGAPMPAAPAAERKRLPRVPGRLQLETTPAGATVWVDGVERGTTPVDLVTGPGGHRVVVVLAGHKMWRDVFDTTEGEIVRRTLVPLPPPPAAAVTANVECRTRGKYPVLVDEQETGRLCPTTVPVAPGVRRVSIFVPQARATVAVEQDVKPGEPAVFRFKE